MRQYRAVYCRQNTAHAKTPQKESLGLKEAMRPVDQRAERRRQDQRVLGVGFGRVGEMR